MSGVRVPYAIAGLESQDSKHYQQAFHHRSKVALVRKAVDNSSAY